MFILYVQVLCPWISSVQRSGPLLCGMVQQFILFFQAHHLHPHHMHWVMQKKKQKSQERLLEKRQEKEEAELRECHFEPNRHRRADGERPAKAEHRASLLYERALIKEEQRKKIALSKEREEERGMEECRILFSSSTT